jgi:hypothetical protein
MYKITPGFSIVTFGVVSLFCIVYNYTLHCKAVEVIDPISEDLKASE